MVRAGRQLVSAGLRQRHRVYQLLDLGFAGDKNGKRVHALLIGLLVLNVIAVVLDSVPAFSQALGPVFIAIEVVSVVVFTLEYLARLWVAVEHGPLEDLPPWKARLVHAFSPGMVIDLLAVLPFYLVWFVAADFRILLVFRLLRFFKIARYSIGMRSLGEAVYAERHALAASFGILVALVLVSASFMHLVEHTSQPDKFGTIPDAMYWAIITLTTVGYGDVVPVTTLGKMIAGFTAILGLLMLALPVGLLATAFAEVIHRRDFVVTWGMVARVPLFSGLDAETIAQLMQYLRSQTAQPGEVIVRKGEMATCMYIIASGDVEADVPGKNAPLSAGDFFGEIALMKDARRLATMRARSRCSLLVLDQSDLHALMERKPAVAALLKASVKARLDAETIEPGHDLLHEELRHHPDIRLALDDAEN